MARAIFSNVVWLCCMLLQAYHVSAAAAVSHTKSLLRTNTHAKNFVQSLEFKHRLRVCNAYPYGSAIDVYQGSEILTEKPMAYKSCKEFGTELLAGDKIEVKVAEANAGAFVVSDLPNNDAVLVLVVYRHDSQSTAMAFESHVFSNLVNSQIAVIDTYKGASKAAARIADSDDAQTHRSEELRYDSVVAVNPGIYEVLLETPDGETKARHELVALNRESYVVLRCGIEAAVGRSYPQELIVYPNSDPKALTGSARSSYALTGLVTMLCILGLRV